MSEFPPVPLTLEGSSLLHQFFRFDWKYLTTTADASFVPPNHEDLEVFLEAYLLDKAVYEIGYELNSRPDWVVIPLRGIKHILKLP